jgi:NAD(P)-dependent dehydrogenase (short-subunit alcohol dehydrogenase family)
MTSTAQVAVITGAAQGIGRRVAEVLADEGYALALTDLHDATETLAAARAGSGGARSAELPPDRSPARLHSFLGACHVTYPPSVGSRACLTSHRNGGCSRWRARYLESLRERRVGRSSRRLDGEGGGGRNRLLRLFS